MKAHGTGIYALSAAVAFAVSFALTPLVRLMALKLGLVDRPNAIKTHRTPTPSLGGVAIWTGFVVTLALLRALTDFPTGTLRSLRGILFGGGALFLIGLIDDVRKPEGLGVGTKFLGQIGAAALLIVFGMRINFIQPQHFAWIVTVVWVVGITNALNLIDIMDGLAASQAAIAGAAFLFISLPQESYYVNFAAAALSGAALGFLPWNFSTRWKIFMGDSGALSLGFVLASISLGTRYSDVNPMGVYCPLLILGVPIYDTLFVMGLRMGRGQNPFKGSKDHYALRLEAFGHNRRRVVAVSAGAALALGACANLVVHVSTQTALMVYAAVGLVLFWVSLALSQRDMREH